ncbi:CobB/CobQ domain protein glutamine amidotransferase [Segniliparus rotundus DSM 44985]|uniref:Lipid II isoglutaminyl synthase (glutamine-hydrolyzing) subunit GatD n=1 Tax=Segniliparus rotundus (strain ATCC BAA-972 / CDC 1076 / CIP 108378 / DSM 44985 / JCM 13578) TaxID=640132 RepID=D6ZCA5_SEGRD|nr:glutamine amidotransferase [Segniliparus rotundus]ADG99074.1 CobB/CobQ domain protein glutamine amidotransferase [Segniliparus rotundus DSM 44985]
MSPAEPRQEVLRIGLVLPDVMGTYGDSGNATVLEQRATLRGIPAEVVTITLDDPVPDSLDIYTIGGAEDAAQRLATEHLLAHQGLQRAAAKGAPVLAICAALQVLGEWYELAEGTKIAGVGLLDVTTRGRSGARSIGEVVLEPRLAGLSEPITGFENHGGASSLGPACQPLGAVKAGDGNAAGEPVEGAVQGSVVSTYLHGPVLARNPQLADLLLARALGVPMQELAPLDLPSVRLLREERFAAPRRG